MDVVWLILDSLSYEATPFNSKIKKTMPNLAELAEDQGVIYHNAYVPGPSSPSSHGSFFTGEPPSITGMHEAYPYFDSDIETIAETLSDSHRSMLISANPYIFNGLDRGFDVTNDLREEEYLVFPEARNPEEYEFDETKGKLGRYLEYIFTSSKPIRTAINGVQYKRTMRKRRSSLPESTDRDNVQFQYASEMNTRIKAFLEENEEDSFVVANYMDIHPPLDASQEAKERFCGNFDPAELPTGVRGQDIYQKFTEGDKEAAEKMYALLQATIWDVDRKISPLIELLIDRDSLVIVTADHGIWFRRKSELDEERIHVPLVIFHPDSDYREIDYTVNIRSLPRTTLSILDHDMQTDYNGKNLLLCDNNTVSITEFIYTSNENGKPINPTGDGNQDIQFELAGVSGETRVDYSDGTFKPAEDEEVNIILQDEIRSRLEDMPQIGNHKIQYDETVKERLEDFGYL